MAKIAKDKATHIIVFVVNIVVSSRTPTPTPTPTRKKMKKVEEVFELLKSSWKSIISIGRQTSEFFSLFASRIYIRVLNYTHTRTLFGFEQQH